MRHFGWYPVLLRELLLFRSKLLKLGYLFSAMVVPIIYLVTFGLGLGRSVPVQGMDYLCFLIPGLVAMSSMNNSYTWVASALNLNRLYFKTFQILVQSPVKPSAIMIGEVLAGMVKGLVEQARAWQFGSTALSNAAFFGHREMVKFLLERGASADRALDALKRQETSYEAENKPVEKVSAGRNLPDGGRPPAAPT